MRWGLGHTVLVWTRDDGGLWNGQAITGIVAGCAGRFVQTGW
jgi:hypothetical protein